MPLAKVEYAFGERGEQYPDEHGDREGANKASVCALASDELCEQRLLLVGEVWLRDAIMRGQRRGWG